MTPDQLDLLRMAAASAHAAQILFDNGYPGFCASRSYYAMFYVAEAFLEGDGLSFSKHSAVIAAFGQHFAHRQRCQQNFTGSSSKRKQPDRREITATWKPWR